MESGIRIGIVSDVKAPFVRVYFKSDDMMSGWLKVINYSPIIPTQKTDTASGGSGEAAFAEHSHGITIEAWMPNVGDTVLCLYDNTTFNGDGYVLGAL